MSTTFEISKSKQNKFNKIQHQLMIGLINKIADEFDLNNQEVLDKCLPEHLTKTSKKNTVKITDFNDANSLDDLKVFKIEQLKDILKDHMLPISGSKQILTKRVWGILHPEEAPVEKSKKKKTQKNNTKIPESKLEVSEVEKQKIEVVEIDPSDWPFFYTRDGIKVSNEEESDLTLKIFNNTWLFIENNDEMEYKGDVSSDGIINWTDEVPIELSKILGME